MTESPGKRGHIVADTLLPMMFLGLRKLGNICCGHKIFLNKIRNIFCVLDTKFVSATNVARAGKRGNVCVGNNVSSFARAFNSQLVLSGMSVSGKCSRCSVFGMPDAGTKPTKNFNFAKNYRLMDGID